MRPEYTNTLASNEYFKITVSSWNACKTPWHVPVSVEPLTSNLFHSLSHSIASSIDCADTTTALLLNDSILSGPHLYSFLIWATKKMNSKINSACKVNYLIILKLSILCICSFKSLRTQFRNWPNLTKHCCLQSRTKQTPCSIITPNIRLESLLSHWRRARYSFIISSRRSTYSISFSSFTVI